MPPERLLLIVEDDRDPRAHAELLATSLEQVVALLHRDALGIVGQPAAHAVPLRDPPHVRSEPDPPAPDCGP